MLEIRQTKIFSKWLKTLKDRRARVRIQARIDRLKSGNIGDVEPVGLGVSELRIHYGPGYRVYFVRQGLVIIVLLLGGDKKSQKSDIKRAQELAKQLED